ncbi:hypothetical protein [Streptomyces sp. NPDC046371]|uniref:hypothetical protein n=1 Tax=Streptomyces sp. NPDC046371 TaxID=3154916 RepID=UPI0033C9B4E1
MGAAVELRYLQVPLEELQRRIALRNHEPGSVVLTADLLRRCQEQLEPPTQAELDLFDAPLLQELCDGAERSHSRMTATSTTADRMSR